MHARMQAGTHTHKPRSKHFRTYTFGVKYYDDQTMTISFMKRCRHVQTTLPGTATICHIAVITKYPIGT